MKKAISATLVFFLLLGLCACDAPAPDGQTGPDYALMVRVTTIPAFNLYLDAQQNILRVQAVNEEAEGLLGQLDLSGKPYAEGMAILLGTAYDRGDLKDGTRIALDIGIVDGNAFDFAAVSAPVSQFEQDKGIQTEMSLSLLEEEVPEGKSTTVINGKTVYICRIPHMDDGVQTGLEITYTYQWVPQFIEPTKYAVKSVYRGNDGSSRVSFYENGVQTRSFHISADGTTSTYIHYSNGNTKTATSSHPNGDYSIVLYYENGNTQSSESLIEGDYAYLTYTEDGIMLLQDCRNADGSYTYLIFEEDGTLLQHDYRNADGSYGESTYNSDGTMIRSVSYDADGRSIERNNYSNGESDYKEYRANGDYYISTYYENGNFKSQESLQDGNHSYQTYSEDGTMLRYEYQNADGSYGSHTYFSDGTEAEYKEYRANGDYYISTHHENGKPKLQESLQNGVYSKSEYEADGSFRYYCDGADGGREFFFSEGKVVKAVIGGTTYTDAEMLSQFAAALGLQQ